MAQAESTFLDFVRLVIRGDVAHVSRRLAANPELARAVSDGGATRQDAESYFFDDIKHYLYAGDTALHMAAAAFQRPTAELLVTHGASCRARNRRSAARSRRMWTVAAVRFVRPPPARGFVRCWTTGKMLKNRDNFQPAPLSQFSTPNLSGARWELAFWELRVCLSLSGGSSTVAN